MPTNRFFTFPESPIFGLQRKHWHGHADAREALDFATHAARHHKKEHTVVMLDDVANEDAQPERLATTDGVLTSISIAGAAQFGTDPSMCFTRSAPLVPPLLKGPWPHPLSAEKVEHELDGYAPPSQTREPPARTTTTAPPTAPHRTATASLFAAAASQAAERRARGAVGDIADRTVAALRAEIAAALRRFETGTETDADATPTVRLPEEVQTGDGAEAVRKLVQAAFEAEGWTITVRWLGSDGFEIRASP